MSVFGTHFDRDNNKNEILKTQRDISFEDVVIAAHEGRILENKSHKDQQAYPGQYMLTIQLNDYARKIPYEIRNNVTRLITIYPSRAATKKFLSPPT